MPDFYTAATDPATSSDLDSSVIRAEWTALAAAFAKVAPYTGNASKAVVINAGGTAQTVTTGTLALAGNFATVGANALTLTTTGSTSLTLPLTGTLATIAGTETFTNKTLTSPTINAGALSGTFSGTPTFSGAVVMSSTLGVTGTLTAGGNVVLSSTGNPTLLTNTSDGSDTRGLFLTGGGALTAARGSYVASYGNEHATLPGDIIISTGGVSGATIDLEYNSSTIARVGATGMFIGDDANANMTLGLTINQGAADDSILSLKSSDVAHGITDEAETDTFGSAQKISATEGGVRWRGFNENARGLLFEGIGVNDNTTKTTSAVAYVEIRASKKSGTGITAPGADANLCVIGTPSAIRFIWDSEGEFHADVGSTTFDEHDDIALIEAMDREFQRRQGNPVTEAYAAHLQEHRETLQRLGIVNYYDPEGKRAMVNMTKQAMLHNGAIRQLAQKFDDFTHTLAGRVETLERLLNGN